MWTWGWDAVAALGQAAEAIIVVIGVVLVFRQLKQLKTEETHKKWDSVQWALSVFGIKEAVELAGVLESASRNAGNDAKEIFEIGDTKILVYALNSLQVIYLALMDEYLDVRYVPFSRVWFATSRKLIISLLSKLEESSFYVSILEQIDYYIEGILQYMPEGEHYKMHIFGSEI